jgi:hypothetical protein
MLLPQQEVSMPKSHHAPQVGAPDPEHRTSPILSRETDTGELSFDSELEQEACLFNDQRYELGEYVRSGSELLHCVERGVWVKVREDHSA